MNTPPGVHYEVTVLSKGRIDVACPVCWRSFKIIKYGIVKCPFCKSKLEYKEKKSERGGYE